MAENKPSKFHRNHEEEGDEGYVDSRAAGVDSGGGGADTVRSQREDGRGSGRTDDGGGDLVLYRYSSTTPGRRRDLACGARRVAHGPRYYGSTVVGVGRRLFRSVLCHHVHNPDPATGGVGHHRLHHRRADDRLYYPRSLWIAEPADEPGDTSEAGWRYPRGYRRYNRPKLPGGVRPTRSSSRTPVPSPSVLGQAAATAEAVRSATEMVAVACELETYGAPKGDD